MKSKQLTPFASGLATFILLLVLTVFFVNTERSRQQDEFRDVTLQLSRMQGDLGAAITRHVSLTAALKFYVSVNPDITREEFARFSSNLLANNSRIRSVSLIKDNVVSDVFPFEANQAALGLRLLDTPGQAEAARRAIASKNGILDGPITLKQGGEAFVHRVPVYTTEEGQATAKKYWGLVSLLIDKQTIVADAKNSIPEGLSVAIELSNSDATETEFLLGDESINLGRPLQSQVRLAGRTWTIYGHPSRGWNRSGVAPQLIRVARFRNCFISRLDGVFTSPIEPTADPRGARFGTCRHQTDAPGIVIR